MLGRVGRAHGVRGALPSVQPQQALRARRAAASLSPVSAPVRGGGVGGMGGGEGMSVAGGSTHLGQHERPLEDQVLHALLRPAAAAVPAAPALAPIPRQQQEQQQEQLQYTHHLHALPSFQDDPAHARQLALEEQSVGVAVQRHVRNVEAARARGDIGANANAARLLVSWHHPLALAARQYLEGGGGGERARAAGKAAGAAAAADGQQQRVQRVAVPRGRARAEHDAWKLMREAEPEALAIITVHTVLSSLMRDLIGMPLAHVALAVGGAVRAQLNLAKLKALRSLTEATTIDTTPPSPTEPYSLMSLSSPSASSYSSSSSSPSAAAVFLARDNGAMLPPPALQTAAKVRARKRAAGKRKKDRLLNGMNSPAGGVSAVNLTAIKADLANATWTQREALLVGTTLIDFMMKCAVVNPGHDATAHGAAGNEGADGARQGTKTSGFVPALSYTQRWHPHAMKRIGTLELTDAAIAALFQDEDEMRAYVAPKLQPMVIRPRPWFSPTSGAYLTIPTQLVRSHPSKKLEDSLAGADLRVVYDGLNALGDTAWRVNRNVLNVAMSLWNSGGDVAGLVSRKDVPTPDRANFVDAKLASKVLKALRAARLASNPAQVDGASSDRAGREGLTSSVRADHLVPRRAPEDSSDDELDPYSQLVADAETAEVMTGLRTYRRERKKARKINRELLSLRANTGYQLDQACAFANEDSIYLPHNVDFRGRAYPIPAYLQHMGADLMRGMLTFADDPGVELGSRGVYWLKVHLANLLGADKLSFEDRIAFAENAIPRAIATASDPLHESNVEWWSNQEDPFQLLATCFEFKSAMGRHGNETTMQSYLSRLPVSMDGSCNGLQHYAALGRDVEGGKQVNLVPGSKPRDVYSGVAVLVQKRVSQAAAAGDSLAQLLDGKISRKLVKQTVMTSVYGVTVIGARAQIENRLREIGGIPDEMMFTASLQLARWTLDSLGDMFCGASRTMDWLASAAKTIAHQGSEVQWLTPLGLPVIQPYRKRDRQVVKTVVQRVFIGTSGDHMPVSSTRQRSAFAPNFVHSIDSSHMLLTAVACRKAGLTFAAVHDSFWTHAATVDEMNAILRKQFVGLHRRELLVELRDNFYLRHPNVELPPLPERGELDLDHVLESPYFFS